MGKVKDGSVAPKAAVSKSPSPAEPKRRFASFFATLFSAGLYKPLQGRLARIWTGVGLATVVVLGLVELFQTLEGRVSPGLAYAIPAGLGVVLGWITFRILHYPPFVEFLIATEAEMNKVSWTSREDLKRATSVVLFTVAFLAIFLFGVDWTWSHLLQAIGVLRINNTSSFGANG